MLSTKASSPTIMDWKNLSKLICYLWTNSMVVINYSKLAQNKIELFIDASWSLYEDSKGQTGGLIKIYGNTIMFRSTKQSIVTLSSTESEIVGVSDFLTYGIWLSRFVTELGIDIQVPISVYQDNISGVKIMNKQHGNFKRTKHFINKYEWIKQHVDSGIIKFIYLPTQHMLADVFTKPIIGYLYYVLLFHICTCYDISTDLLEILSKSKPVFSQKLN